MLDEAELKVKQMTYDPKQPVDIVYNAVEDLHDLSHSANSIYTQQQLMNMAYNILSSRQEFSRVLYVSGTRNLQYRRLGYR